MTICKNKSDKFNVYITLLPRRYNQFNAAISYNGRKYSLGYFNDVNTASYYADLAILFRANSINVVTNELSDSKKSEMLNFAKTFSTFYDLKIYCYSKSDSELSMIEIKQNRLNGLYDVIPKHGYAR
jgi:hypothetical protein